MNYLDIFKCRRNKEVKVSYKSIKATIKVVLMYWKCVSFCKYTNAKLKVDLWLTARKYDLKELFNK